MRLLDKMKLFLEFIIFFTIDGINMFMEVKATTVVVNDFAKLVACDEDFIKMSSFKFYKKRRNLGGALNVTYTQLQEMKSDDQAKVNIAALQFRGNEYKKTVIDFSLGLCTLYKLNKFNAADFLKDSNLTAGCPFHPGVYYINDMAPTADMLPPFFPEGKWLFDVTFTGFGKTITQVHWMLTVMKKI